MKKVVLQLVCAILIFVLSAQVVRADVAPPGPTLFALSLIALVGLGLLVAVIVLVSFLVIRAIKKKHTTTDET
jgi:hypothetical protein